MKIKQMDRTRFISQYKTGTILKSLKMRVIHIIEPAVVQMTYSRHGIVMSYYINIQPCLHRIM